ncbi:MAG: adenylate/guanylate cyclase domain-containing protein [Gammaproteobacteria bacterium]|nr:adenylate/guanylate cyclase domain-containing protein [Gammaproteobacteria bacterium]MCP5196037.1 adenylate/guanylate cyclase domain-containing protein [Gammaproteobacteria bacterium]
MPRIVHTLLRIGLSASIMLALIAHTNGSYSLTFVNQLESFAYDVRLRLTCPGGVDPRIVIVDIDDDSLLQEGQWPWPRRRLAELVDLLFDDYRIRLLAFDMVFPETERDSAWVVLQTLAQGALREDAAFQQEWAVLRTELSGDARFAASLQERPVVLGYSFAMPGEQGQDLRIGQLPPAAAPLAVLASAPNPFVDAAGYSANLPSLQASARGGGFFNSPLIDQDGLIRRLPLLLRHDGQLYENLSLAVLRTLLGGLPLSMVFGVGYHDADGRRVEAVRVGVFDIPVDTQGAVLIPYRGMQGSFPYFSARAILNRQIDPNLLTGAIVLVGTTAAGLLDLRATPVQNIYPGVEIHANLIAGILDQRLKYQPVFARGLETLLLLCLGGLSIALGFTSPLKALLGMLALAAVTFALNLYAWQVLNWVLPAAPALLLLLLYLFQSIYGYFVQARRERRLSYLFGQYVPRELVAEMSRQPGGYALGGESRDMTVLFSDLQDFTTLSETLDPHQLTRLMQFILTPLTQVIHEQHGTVDKYIGDAIMAFWGAPLPDPKHARHAVDAALAMKARLEALTPELRARGWPSLRIRIGVNSGVMNVGNMGSEFRVAYTVLGDAVNLAARLEGAAKQYGVAIVMSETTRAVVTDIAWRELDRVRVKGRIQPVTLFEPLGTADALTETMREELVEHDRALAAYRAGAWEQASARFEALQAQYPEQPLYGIYRERIAVLRADPPATEWDGVFTLTVK